MWAGGGGGGGGGAEIVNKMRMDVTRTVVIYKPRVHCCASMA